MNDTCKKINGTGGLKLNWWSLPIGNVQAGSCVTFLSGFAKDVWQFLDWMEI